MKWDTATSEELVAVNEFLRGEPLALEVNCGFKRYARRKGERDKLVHFESDVTLQLLKVEAIDPTGEVPSAYYLTFYEPRERLFLVLNDQDFHALFSAENRDLLGSTMLWAIKKSNKKDTPDAEDELFGTF